MVSCHTVLLQHLATIRKACTLLHCIASCLYLSDPYFIGLYHSFVHPFGIAYLWTPVLEGEVLACQMLVMACGVQLRSAVFARVCNFTEHGLEGL